MKLKKEKEKLKDDYEIEMSAHKSKFNDIQNEFNKKS